MTPTWGWLASGYGWRRHPMGGGTGHHWGIDIAARHGTPVLATMDGTVAFTGFYGAYGLVIYLLHAGGWYSLYGHLSAVRVRPGQTVRCGQAIGAVGSTGASTGPHLHFELRYRGYPVDPIPYLMAAYRRARKR
jgi:murein DD-endopeptidase MepM/ murein hydrolase activator NlpD